MSVLSVRFWSVSVCQYQETVRAKRFSSASMRHQAHGDTNAAANILRLGEIKAFKKRFALGQTVNGRLSHGPKPVPR